MSNYSMELILLGGMALLAIGVSIIYSHKEKRKERSKENLKSE